MQKKNEPVFSKKLRAGRRRTYFFDVRPTRSNDFYLTITESKKRYNDDGYDRHKIFLYKEDFHKFIDALNETVNHVKSDLLPEYDFDEFSHSYDDENYVAPDKKQESSEVVDEAESDSKEDETVDSEPESEKEEDKKEEDDDDLKWD